jgi:hypothetical protein
MKKEKNKVEIITPSPIIVNNIDDIKNQGRKFMATNTNIKWILDDNEKLDTFIYLYQNIFNLRVNKYCNLCLQDCYYKMLNI